MNNCYFNIIFRGKKILYLYIFDLYIFNGYIYIFKIELIFLKKL